jgi:SET domain
VQFDNYNASSRNAYTLNCNCFDLTSCECTALLLCTSGKLFPADKKPATKLLMQLFFAIQSNAHAISSSTGVCGVGLFPLGSMLNHSCVPNAHHSFTFGGADRQLPTLVFRSAIIHNITLVCCSRCSCVIKAPLCQVVTKVLYHYNCSTAFWCLTLLYLCYHYYCVLCCAEL